MTANATQQVHLDRSVLARFCQSHHIRRLALFGSQLKGTAGPESDVDLLVEFDPAHMPGLLAVAAMELELSDIVGRKVELRTARDLSKHFRDEVVRTAEVRYAA
jgi:predicted nucleotidyltransferase